MWCGDLLTLRILGELKLPGQMNPKTITPSASTERSSGTCGAVAKPWRFRAAKHRAATRGAKAHRQAVNKAWSSNHAAERGDLRNALVPWISKSTRCVQVRYSVTGEATMTGAPERKRAASGLRGVGVLEDSGA